MKKRDIVSTIDTLYIVRDTLNGVDERLVGHGERVAYIVSQMLKEENCCTEDEQHQLCLLALLHDIGAYKTEEITSLLSFETTECWAHSIYGYLFLKSFSPLKALAEVILYHHLPYSKFDENHIDPIIAKYAQLFLLVDRIDIISGNNDSDFCLNYIETKAGFGFSAYWVDIFKRANNNFHIFESLKNGLCVDKIDCVFASAELSEEERLNFLSMAAYAIDFRSEFMVLHTVTTVNVTRIICRLLNLSDAEIDEICLGALLHDIGKTGTPTKILEKPGKLDDGEMKIMKDHVTIGEEILFGRIPEKIARIALRHHEKLDGSGYPKGLLGHELTLNERIVAVADIVSALIRKRSYKDAFDTERCKNVLSDMRDNGKICPRVTGIVLENLDEIIEETNASSKRLLDIYYGLKNEFDIITQQIADL